MALPSGESLDIFSTLSWLSLSVICEDGRGDELMSRCPSNNEEEKRENEKVSEPSADSVPSRGLW